MTDTTTTTGAAPAAPVPGSPEYDAAMAAKFRSSEGSVAKDTLEQFAAPKADTAPAAGATKERPADIPEKFWDAEKGEVRVADLLKSYTELESGKGKTPDPAATPEADAAAADKAKEAGLNWDDLGAKIATNGNIDASDYEALAKVGVPKDLVDQYIELLTERSARATADAETYGGGKEATDALLTWASQTLTPQEITGYNQMLAGPNWKVAIDTLKTRQAQAKPGAQEPNLQLPNGGGGGGTVFGYATEAEMHVDMRNPLYNQMTPAGEQFRAQVMEKTRLAAYRRQK